MDAGFHLSFTQCLLHTQKQPLLLHEATFVFSFSFFFRMSIRDSVIVIVVIFQEISSFNPAEEVQQVFKKKKYNFTSKNCTEDSSSLHFKIILLLVEKKTITYFYKTAYASLTVLPRGRRRRRVCLIYVVQVEQGFTHTHTQTSLWGISFTYISSSSGGGGGGEKKGGN